MSNADVVRTGFAAAARGDFDAIRDLLDPDVRWHGGDPSAPDACRDRDAALAFMRGARDRGQIGELVDVIEVGDRVVVIMRPPTGELRANLTRFRDGRVVEMVAFESPQDALAAAGQPPR